ncbi:hypothetical protein, partial [Bacillus pumilus]|uniref:hypothetical protein n=1 Tax=Bacillus pumilus TaxID=1408 RepID=UPI001642C71E
RNVVKEVGRLCCYVLSDIGVLIEEVEKSDGRGEDCLVEVGSFGVKDVRNCEKDRTNGVEEEDEEVFEEMKKR